MRGELIERGTDVVLSFLLPSDLWGEYWGYKDKERKKKELQTFLPPQRCEHQDRVLSFCLILSELLKLS